MGSMDWFNPPLIKASYGGWDKFMFLCGRALSIAVAGLAGTLSFSPSNLVWLLIVYSNKSSLFRASGANDFRSLYLHSQDVKQYLSRYGNGLLAQNELRNQVFYRMECCTQRLLSLWYFGTPKISFLCMKIRLTVSNARTVQTVNGVHSWQQHSKISITRALKRVIISSVSLVLNVHKIRITFACFLQFLLLHVTKRDILVLFFTAQSWKNFFSLFLCRPGLSSYVLSRLFRYLTSRVNFAFCS